MSGMAMRKDGDADVSVTVSWQRTDETTMRTTELTQRWTDKRGTWYDDLRGGEAAATAA